MNRRNHLVYSESPFARPRIADADPDDPNRAEFIDRIRANRPALTWSQRFREIDARLQERGVPLVSRRVIE